MHIYLFLSILQNTIVLGTVLLVFISMKNYVTTKLLPVLTLSFISALTIGAEVSRDKVISQGQTMSNSDTTDSQTTIAFRRHAVKFQCADTECAAWLYLPKSASQQSPVAAVAMAPGIGSLKEMGLIPYAERFAEAGIATLLFDFRHWGESGGLPREQAIPQQQIDDYRHALTYLSMRADVDEKRLGLWGSSFSGGHVLQVAALDERVKALVSQTPPTDLHGIVRSRGTAESQNGLFTNFAKERKRFAESNEAQYIPIAAMGKANGAFMDDDTFLWQEEMKKQHAPHFRNRISLGSLEAIYEYAPLLWIPRISPKPLLMILASEDKIVSPDSIWLAFKQAGEPKKLLELNTGHYGVYSGENLDKAASAAREWFLQHL